MVVSVEQLVGRAAEVEMFEHALAALGDGSAGAVEVAGEPGMGKTRILAEFAALADASGCLVLSGSASELERGLPFWVFVDALDDYVRGLDPRRLAALGEEERSELGQFLPALREAGAARGGDGADERYHTHRAVARLLELLAERKGLVLLLDDLHWADSGSIELLGSLLRRPPAGVLVGVALRPRQQPELLLASLERARRDGVLTRIELESLSADEARELVGDTVGSAAAAELYAQSGGNPFYLEQLARSPRQRQPRALDGEAALADTGVPVSVAASLAEELGLLPEQVRRVLEGAAVVGDPFEPELAAATAGLPEAATMEALDELLRRDLVRPTEVPRRFRFRHPLVRRAVYEAAPAGWRLTGHERAANALEARGTDAPERAHHVERSARQGDTAAVAVLREAGKATAPRAPATAARSYAAALRLLPGDGDPGERIELLSALAAAHVAAGQYHEAYGALLESLPLLPAEPRSQRVGITAACAGMELLLSRHDQAHTRLLTALAELPDTPSPEAAALMIELSVDGLYRMEYASMGDWAKRARDTAAALGDRRLAAAGAGLAALGFAFSGALDEARRHCTEAAALLDGFSDEERAGSLDHAAQSTTGAELYLGRYEEASAHAERTLALARATGQGQAVPILFWVGTVRWMTGRLAEAAEVLDTAGEIARLTGHEQGLTWTLFGRSLAATAAGEVETALAAAEESVEVLPEGDRSFPGMWARFALAAALQEAGSSEDAARALLDAGGGDGLPLVPAACRTTAFELLTRCRLSAGDRAAAGAAAAPG